jgi:hypothetical protein
VRVSTNRRRRTAADGRCLEAKSSIRDADPFASSRFFYMSILDGRDGGIRTRDPLNPMAETNVRDPRSPSETEGDRRLQREPKLLSEHHFDPNLRALSREPRGDHG